MSRHNRLVAPAEGAWAVHEERAGTLVAEPLCGFGASHCSRQFDRARTWGDELFSQPPQVIGSAFMLLIRAFAAERPVWMATEHITDLSRWKPAVTRDDAFLAARTALGMGDLFGSGWVFKVVAAMLHRAVADGPVDDGEAATIRAVATSLEHRHRMSVGERRSVRARLLALLPPGDSGTVDTSVIVPVDGWALSVLPELATSPSAEAVSGLLRHLATGRGSQPQPQWLATVGDLLADDEAVRVLRLLIDRLTTAEPIAATSRYGTPVELVLDEQNIDVARAAVWATTPLAREWVVPTLHRLAVRGVGASGASQSPGGKIPNACVFVLGSRGTPDAVAALQQLAGASRHNGFRKRIAVALGVAADACGLTPGELVERAVPTGGLDATGSATLTSGTVTARIGLDDRFKVTTEWQTAGGWAARVPAGTPAADVNRIRRAVKELNEIVATERRRVEALLATDRSWEIAQWRRYYLDHPITGGLTRRLIWIFDSAVAGDSAVTGDSVVARDSAATRLVGVPLDAGTLRTTGGERALPAAGTVRLWHPATADEREVAAWRDWLVRAGLGQPFKQAYREVYLLTPAERETARYSNRFAAHVLRYQQLYALVKERRWVSNYLGSYDGGSDGRARREFPDAGLTVVFEHDQVDSEVGAEHTNLCTTERVWFFRTGDRTRAAVPLEHVPPLVFSEAMRDVDLFVGVTSIALDPTWADRGEDPHYDYWLIASFDELSATAKVRRDVLAALLPKLKIADRVELGDRYVSVRGTRASYRVHIGTANVRIEPGGRYLCIVPAGGGRTKRVMLPFEGDEVLSVVLSKVLMLADDDKITDPGILRQLAPRRRDGPTGSRSE